MWVQYLNSRNSDGLHAQLNSTEEEHPPPLLVGTVPSTSSGCRSRQQVQRWCWGFLFQIQTWSVVTVKGEAPRISFLNIYFQNEDFIKLCFPDPVPECRQWHFGFMNLNFEYGMKYLKKKFTHVWKQYDSLVTLACGRNIQTLLRKRLIKFPFGISWASCISRVYY